MRHVLGCRALAAACLTLTAPAEPAGAVCTPAELWRWEGRIRSSTQPEPCGTPLVLQLTDDDGDGRIGTLDRPDVAFIHFNIPSLIGVITAVVHQTVIGVDEKGTEAAAATGVVISDTSVPEPGAAIVVDRPFVLAIRDQPTDTLLFLGRVLEPATSE